MVNRTMEARASLPPAIFWHLQPRPIPGSMNIEQKYVPFQTPVMKTPYMVMTLQANEAPATDNILAGLFSWITLAGYVVFPGSFTSLKKSNSLDDSKSGRIVKDAVQYMSLLPIAGLCCLIGISGTIWMWKRWRKNYVWLVGRLFL